MNAAKLISRGGVMLGLALAATALSVSTASAGLTGTVYLQTYTTATGGASPTAFEITFTSVYSASTLGDFAKYKEPLNTANPPAFDHLKLEYLNKDQYKSSQDFTIDFGTRTFGTQVGDLKFTILKDSVFDATIIPLFGSTLFYNFNFKQSTPPMGEWSFAGSGTPNVTAKGFFNLMGGPSGTPYLGQSQILITSVPEPSTYLAGLGSMGLLNEAAARRRKGML